MFADELTLHFHAGLCSEYIPTPNCTWGDEGCENVYDCLVDGVVLILLGRSEGGLCETGL